jgi:hypothetical protein
MAFTGLTVGLLTGAALAARQTNRLAAGRD